MIHDFDFITKEFLEVSDLPYTAILRSLITCIKTCVVFPDPHY